MGDRLGARVVAGSNARHCRIPLGGAPNVLCLQPVINATASAQRLIHAETGQIQQCPILTSGVVV